MRTLIRFFLNHHLFFLFLVLEGCGFLLLVQNNYIQRDAFVNNMNVVSGSMYSQMSKWHEYLILKRINQSLLEENTRLHNISSEAYDNIDTTRRTNVNLVTRQRYIYSSAKVINNSTNKQYNYLTINRGRNQGVAADMAVIGPDGIVGTVYGVSDNFATVIPVINTNFRISTKFKKNDYYGALTWDGYSYRYATLHEIALHVPVTIGDTLVVSGFSDSFPEGILVGFVDKVEAKDGNFYTIDVRLATDFRSLHYVTVIEDLLKSEKEDLEAKILEND